MSLLVFFLILVFLLVLVRVALPFVVLSMINRRLLKLKSYKGRVAKINIHILQGTATFYDLVVDRSDVKDQPFFTISDFTIKLNIRQLLQRKVVGDVNINRLKLNWYKTSKSPDVVRTDETKPFNLRKTLEGLFPFKVNVKITNSQILYLDALSDPPIDARIKDIDICLNDVSNMSLRAGELPTVIEGTAKVYTGNWTLSMKTNLMEEFLTFDMNSKLENLDLPLLNDFLKKYAGVDLEAGRFDMYMEVAARGGSFKGYVKPVLSNLDVIGLQDKDDNLLNRLWEGVMAFAYQVLKNKKEDQLSTKISIEGKISDPRINIVSAVLLILQNGFIHAIRPSVDNVINIDSVKESFSKTKRFFARLIGGEK